MERILKYTNLVLADLLQGIHDDLHDNLKYIQHVIYTLDSKRVESEILDGLVAKTNKKRKNADM
jgi:hypothetical protein